jgi:steroid 5-alpha reductase family enzyme
LLLFLITTPTYILLLCSRITGDELDTYDQVFSKLVFLLIMLEFFADQQQWNFHQAKNYYKKTAKVPKEYKFTREQLDRGFNTVGLFAWSRHPNFAAEQAVWCALYQWCCVESFTFVNWAFLGTFAYLLLFQASTWFTEMITSEKYPEYAVYQKKVGKFLPKGNTKSMEEPKKPVEKKAVEENKKTSKGPAKGKGRKR